MIKEAISFWNNPRSSFNIGENDSFKDKIIYLQKYYIIYFTLAITAAFAISLLDNLLESKFNISIYQNLLRNRNIIYKHRSQTMAIIETCIIAPLEEELFFRFSLVTCFIFIRISILFLAAICIILANIIDIPALILSTSLLLFFLAASVFNRTFPQKYTITVKQVRYNYVCWSSIIIFALMHITNFTPLNWTVIYLYPIYIIPQFISGVLLSLMAVRYNSIVLSLLLHIAINSTAVIYGQLIAAL